MHIEELRASQIPEVVQLWHDAGLTRPWNDPAADARQALATETSTVLVAVENDAIIASVMVGFDGHKGWVYYVAVAPGQQGRGLGRIIMDAAIKWLEKFEAVELMLLVREGNEQVQGFYESLGFGRDEVFVMSRRLQS
ncbi:GNAT family acetyltransferase [Corynebacterium halotolerans]|uniref:Putative acetyltransferase n=1 Tax=Corynebacterium halotolerans YIM 70093 = DSM 44683 TaxID=1121362 RepID=M1NRP2_9CORY|nr:GNAT family acetyltransferase [Corynebacterium halotolerans]AGF72177.1 putative acetyltransferase [Corynebacterium halotolerans YIM 70093 = DSM 44683]